MRGRYTLNIQSGPWIPNERTHSGEPNAEVPDDANH